MTIPWLGDLGAKGQYTNNGVDDWYSQYDRYLRYLRYYSGVVLEERVESPGEENPPLLYPVKMNLVKLMCHTQADSLWGEWEDRIFHLQAFPRDGEVEAERIQHLLRYVYNVLDENAIEPKLWECGLDQMRFGGAVLRVSRDPRRQYGVRIERIPVSAFYPLWSPDSYDELMEVSVVTEISAQAAQAYFGVEVSGDTVIRVEHWTRDRYENFIDNKRIDRFSGVNRLNRIPFVYIPRFRSDSFYGEALTEDITGVQDELNMRVGDMGEAITYNAHPIKWGYNLPKDINNSSKYPYAPDRLWDLGNHLPGTQPPALNVLEAKNPVPDAAFHHIQFVYDWARAAGYSPPVAFGEDEGSQRSGATLVLRMWPLTRAIRRTRLYWKPALIQIFDLVMSINSANGTKSTPQDIAETYHQVMMDVDFAPVLPRERAELVNEVVMRAQTDPPSISQEGALELLGVRDAQRELERIEDQQEAQREAEQEAMEAQRKVASKPSGGSSENRVDDRPARDIS
jgi:hypothetical protein